MTRLFFLLFILFPSFAYAGISNGSGTGISLTPAATSFDASAITGGTIATARLPVATTGVQGIAQVGGGLAVATGTVSSNAIDHISYQPGLLTALNATKTSFHKISKAATVDNIEGSANTFSCVSNPTITVFECGTSSTCAASPVTIGTVTIAAAGAVVDGTINSSAITAGDYVAFAETAGTCASSDIAVTVQIHAN